MSELEFRFRLLEFLSLCAFQDNLLLLIAYIKKWRFGRIICKAPYDLVFVYLSSFIDYSSLLNIFPSLAISWDFIAWFMLYMCLQYLIFYDLTDVFNNSPQVLPTLRNFADTYTICFMLFLLAPLASYAFLFHNITNCLVFTWFMSLFFHWAENF